MGCPFELPVKFSAYIPVKDSPVDNGYIDDAKGNPIIIPILREQADYIVVAINSHKKLVNVCEKAKWLYDELALSTLGAACKYGDNYEPPTKEDCLKIRELLEQALKEAEKPK